MALTIEELTPQGMPEYCTAVSFVNPTTGETEYMLEAEVGTKKYEVGGPWHVCPLCGHEFPEKKMVEVAGTFYCVEFKDYLAAIEQIDGRS